ncbi:MAG: methyltransferase domain-containing protein [Turneriella sp.]|mgnify:FL=1
MSRRPPEIDAKLRRILSQKNARGGEFCLPAPSAPDQTSVAAFKPYDIRHDFPGYKKYALEIGCGWGEFTRATAAAEPQTFFVAIEKKLARVIASGREQQTSGIGNIRYLVLDVTWFFDGIFAAQSFDSITINFPDPWPKARHHKHRFVSDALAAELRRIAAPGATLTFATDDYVYTREAMQVFESSAAWKNRNGSFMALDHIDGRAVSYFEQVHRAEGAPIYFLEYTTR